MDRREVGNGEKVVMQYQSDCLILCPKKKKVLDVGTWTAWRGKVVVLPVRIR
jgi:hypothetical protein